MMKSKAHVQQAGVSRKASIVKEFTKIVDELFAGTACCPVAQPAVQPAVQPAAQPCV